MPCPLCEMEKKTPWLLVICKCSSHPEKVMLVWGKHEANPSQEDIDKMRATLKIWFPNKKFREPASLKGHYHLHENT